MRTATVMGIDFRAHAGPGGTTYVHLGEIAEEYGIDRRDVAPGVALLPRRMRNMVVRVEGGSAVPLRWLCDLAGRDADEIPRQLTPLWLAAIAHYRPGAARQPQE